MGGNSFGRAFRRLRSSGEATPSATDTERPAHAARPPSQAATTEPVSADDQERAGDPAAERQGLAVPAADEEAARCLDQVGHRVVGGDGLEPVLLDEVPGHGHRGQEEQAQREREQGLQLRSPSRSCTATNMPSGAEREDHEQDDDDQGHRPPDARLDAARRRRAPPPGTIVACTTPSTATPASCAAIRADPAHRGQRTAG